MNTQLTVNKFLEPLVDELQQLLHPGIKVSASNKEIDFKAALVCVACDTPATRKTGGFVGHSRLL